MALTLLTICTDAADQLGIVRPSSVYGNAATEARKLLRYANQTGIHLRKLDWQILRSEQTFTSVATEAQTSTMVPSDLDHFVNETFWNRTGKRPFKGPFSPQDWQALKATTAVAINESYTYRGGIFYIQPVPTAGHTFAYEYVSKKYCQSAGGTAAAAWAADTDTARLDEEMFTLGVIWRYKHGESLPWEADYKIYEDYVMLSFGQDMPRQTISMTRGSFRAGTPGIVVPEGSWLQ